MLHFDEQLTTHVSLGNLNVDLESRGTINGECQTRMNIGVCQVFVLVRLQAVDVLEQLRCAVEEMRERRINWRVEAFGGIEHSRRRALAGMHVTITLVLLVFRWVRKNIQRRFVAPRRYTIVDVHFRVEN